MMNVLHYKTAQISIFDFEKETDTRQALNDRINKILGLNKEPTFQKMLEACLEKPHFFSEPQRRFLKDMIFLHLDKISATSRQIRYLSNLYQRTVTN